MSNELVKISHAEIMETAKLFAESGMFVDAKSMAQAFVKIAAGKEIGIPAFAAMSGIHIIQGKPALGAGLMAGCVKGSPKYDYKVTKLDETECSITFTTKQGAILGVSSFTLADAKKAQTKNLDKFPKNMLFARAMSNGVKWYCPDVFTMPVYTPEEMGDTNFTEDITHEELPPAPPAKKQKATPVAIKAAVERIENGEAGIADKMKETFDLTAAQIKELEAAKPKAWQLTPDQQKQAQSLMDSSTMDADRKAACAIAIATCTTQEGFDKIIAHLQTLQSA